MIEKLFDLIYDLYKNQNDIDFNKLATLELFNNPKNHPWNWMSETKKKILLKITQSIGLGHHIVSNKESIYFDSHEQQILNVLSFLHKEKLLTNDVYSTLVGKQRSAPIIASSYISLHQAGLFNPSNQTLILDLCAKNPRKSDSLSYHLYLLNNKKALTQKIFNIFLSTNSDDANELAEGLLHLKQKNILNDKYIDTLARFPKNAHSLAQGIAHCHEAKVTDEYHTNLLASHVHPYSLGEAIYFFTLMKLPESYLNFAAKLACPGDFAKTLFSMHKSSIKIDNHITMLFNKYNEAKSSHSLIFSRTINTLFDKNLIDEKNISCIFFLSYEEISNLSNWMRKLADFLEPSLLTTENLKLLLQYKEILLNSIVIKSLDNWKLRMHTYPRAQHWVIDLTQSRFSYLIKLCETYQHDSSHAVKSITSYMNKLSEEAQSVPLKTELDELSPTWKKKLSPVLHPLENSPHHTNLSP